MEGAALLHGFGLIHRCGDLMPLVGQDWRFGQA